MIVLKILLFVAMGATVAALVFGVFSLFRGGDFNKKYGNAAMRWRILLQATALIIFALLIFFGR